MSDRLAVEFRLYERHGNLERRQLQLKSFPRRREQAKNFGWLIVSK